MARVAITGYSAGIGQAFAKIYQDRGHEVVGLSRRNGYNIRNLPKCLEQIKPCDIFINNAQVGFAQTELLFAVYEAWRDIPNKKIINISTIMTSYPISIIEGYDRLCLVKPGKINTQHDWGVNTHSWANRIVDTLDSGPYMQVEEIAIGEYQD